MKFSKSERALHQQNSYNPPSNYYQLQNNTKHKILTGSLAGPAISNYGNFGYQKRFHQDYSQVPGPGSYLNNLAKQPHHNQQHNKIFKSNLRSIEKSASIPQHYYGQIQDDDQQQYIQQLLLKEDVNKSHKKTKKEVIAFSFGKSEKISSFQPKKQQINIGAIKKQIDDEIIQVIPDQNQQNSFKSIKKSVVWKQKIHKSNEKRRETFNCINPQKIPSLELIELLTKRRNKKYYPGPGQYTPDQMQPIISKSGIIGLAQRFTQDKNTIIGPGLYDTTENNLKGSYTFQRSQRNLFSNEIANVNPNYRFYIDPQNSTNIKSKSMVKLNSPFNSSCIRAINMPAKQIIIQKTQVPKKNNKLISIAKKHKYLHKQQSEKNEGLLGLSTMVSSIQ